MPPGMPPAAMVLLVPASVRPFDAMNGMSSSLWPFERNMKFFERLGLRPIGTGRMFTRGWVETRRSGQRRAVVSLNDLVGAGEDRVQGRRSGLRRRPVVDAAQRAAHQLRAVAIGQPVGNAERLDPLFIGQQFDRAGPVGSPHTAVETKGVEDAAERVPDVSVRERFVRQCAGAGNLDGNIGIGRERQHLRQFGPGLRRRRRLHFFFQAEDGIRDLYVPGVQTCALPIYLARLGEGWLRFLAGDYRAGRVRLGGLGPEEVVALGRALGAGKMPRRAVSRLLEETGGNPLYCRAVLEEAAAGGADLGGAALPVPRSLAGMVLARARALSPGARRLAEAAAVLGHHCELGAAAALADLADPVPALAEALAAGILAEEPGGAAAGIGFSHLLVQRAVYEDLSPARRRRLHQRAAGLVDRDRALGHRVAAAIGPDDGLAAEL